MCELRIADGERGDGGDDLRGVIRRVKETRDKGAIKDGASAQGGYPQFGAASDPAWGIKYAKAKAEYAKGCLAAGEYLDDVPCAITYCGTNSSAGSGASASARAGASVSASASVTANENASDSSQSESGNRWFECPVCWLHSQLGKQPCGECAPHQNAVEANHKLKPVMGRGSDWLAQKIGGALCAINNAGRAKLVLSIDKPQPPQSELPAYERSSVSVDPALLMTGWCPTPLGRCHPSLRFHMPLAEV